MSLAVKRGKRRGDPGLWSTAIDVGKAFLTGGPGAGISQLGTELGLWGGPTAALPQININPPFGGPRGAGWELGLGPVSVGGSIGEVREVAGMIAPPSTNGHKAPSGYHWNKTGYFVKGTRDGMGPRYIEAGTKLVRNRRRNPANARAIDRAMGRLESADRLKKKLSRVRITPKCKCK